MSNKELYETPELEIIVFNTEDVITTSPLADGPNDTPTEQING